MKLVKLFAESVSARLESLIMQLNKIPRVLLLSTWKINYMEGRR